MKSIELLTPEERAKQLREPDGAIGLAVAKWISEHNREGNEKTVSELRIRPGSQVLEIGFGVGRTAPNVIVQAENVHYTGIDISPTMVEEARRFNADLVRSGQARFFLGSAQNMPFTNNVFDCVFSIGVIHFWADPEGALLEVHRVLKPGGLMLMGCLAPENPPVFARPEFGFHLREATAWEGLCTIAGFFGLNVSSVVIKQEASGGRTVELHAIRLEGYA